MTARRSGVLLTFTFAISLGYCATISPSLSFATPTATEPLPTQLQRSSHNTGTVDCDEDYYTCRSDYTGDICRCDELGAMHTVWRLLCRVPLHTQYHWTGLCLRVKVSAKYS